MPLETRQREMLGELVSFPSHGDNERPILERIEEYFAGSGCVVRRVPIVGDPHGRWSLVVEKGKGPKSVLLYGHVDTFSPRWKNVNYKMRREGGKLFGPGVYDMKAGVMEIIDHMLHQEVPAGMKWIAVFSPDEELHSRGAADKDLQESLRNEDIVAGFSPDITIVPGHDSEDPKPIVVGRRGAFKGDVKIHSSHGHGAKDEIMSATALYHAAYDLFMAAVRDRMPTHMNAVTSMDVAGINIPEAPDLSKAPKGRATIKVFLAPGITVNQARDLLRAQIAGLMPHVRLRTKRGVRSYDPYCIDLDTRMAKAIFAAAEQVYRRIALVVDNSPSDGNVWVPWLQSLGKNVAWIEGAGRGGGEHSRDEWIDEDSIATHMDFTRESLIRRIPDALAA